MAQFLVLILAPRELVVPLANKSIMSRRSIQLFRHLKHQNLFTDKNFMHIIGIYLVLFMATKEILAPLANDLIILGRSIQLFRYLECQNLFIISDFIDRGMKGGQIPQNGKEQNRGAPCIVLELGYWNIWYRKFD